MKSKHSPIGSQGSVLPNKAHHKLGILFSTSATFCLKLLNSGYLSAPFSNVGRFFNGSSPRPCELQPPPHPMRGTCECRPGHSVTTQRCCSSECTPSRMMHKTTSLVYDWKPSTSPNIWTWCRAASIPTTNEILTFWCTRGQKRRRRAR